jgi:hypothetical protein
VTSRFLSKIVALYEFKYGFEEFLRIKANIFGRIYPSHIVFGISLRLVAGLRRDSTDLKRTPTIKDPKKDHHMHILTDFIFLPVKIIEHGLHLLLIFETAC